MLGGGGCDNIDRGSHIDEVVAPGAHILPLVLTEVVARVFTVYLWV